MNWDDESGFALPSRLGRTQFGSFSRSPGTPLLSEQQGSSHHVQIGQRTGHKQPVGMGIRWDAVVQDNDFWSESARQSPEAPVADAKRPVCVQAWLFGSLADGVAKRPVTVEFRGPFSVRDVIAELGRLYGRAFLDRVTDPGGGIFRNCRVFVNGQAADDAATLIQTEALQTEIELILLTAAEGG